MLPVTATEQGPVPRPTGHTAAALRSKALTLFGPESRLIPATVLQTLEQPPVHSYPAPSVGPEEPQGQGLEH